MNNWGDMEYVLAVAQSGSVAAAARALNVNHTTVLRRVKAFENHVNIRIFNRLRTGYELTSAGELFLDAAQSINAVVEDLDRKIAGQDPELSGNLSITTTDSILLLLSQDIGEFKRLNPGVSLDFAITSNHMNLDNRDADIAIRASNTPPSHLVGRRICDINFAIYATQDLLKAEMRTSLENRQWLGILESWAPTPAVDWMEQNIPADQIVLRSNSFVVQCALAEQGVGHAILPRFIGDTSEKLVRLTTNDKIPGMGLWLLSHKDVLRSRRVRTGTDFFYQALTNKTALFVGED